MVSTGSMIENDNNNNTFEDEYQKFKYNLIQF